MGDKFLSGSRNNIFDSGGYNAIRKRFSSGFLSLVFLFAYLGGFAQTSLTTTQLLSDKPIIPGSTLLQSNLQFLKETKQGMPVIRGMEIRSETDEADLSRQEYMFRMSFNNKDVRTVQDNLVKNNVRFYELKSQLIEEAALIDRYELIVDWYYVDEELSYLQEKKILYEDEKTIYQKMLANSLELDINNLLKVNESIQELDRNVLQLNLRKEYLMGQLLPDLDLSAGYGLNNRGWISLQTMEMVLNGVKDLPFNNLAQAIQEVELGMERLQFDMEEAESNQVLDFIQLKYAGRNNLEFKNELSFGIGFNLPTKSTSRIKLNEAKLDIFDEELKQEILEANFKEKMEDYYAGFNALLKEHQLIQQQVSNNELEKTFEKYSKAGAVHPLTLLRIKESLLRNKRDLQKIEEEACMLFLKILGDKGLLSQSPVINYLSDGLEAL